MTSDVASSEPRKRSWKRLIVVLACVVAVALAVLFLKTPAPEPVTVRFVDSTITNGLRVLHFQGSNGLPRRITFFAGVITNSIYHSPAQDVFVRVLDDFDPRHNPAKFDADARASFTFTVHVPPKEVPYHVTWDFFEENRPATRWERFQIGCYTFFRDHGMRLLARPFVPKPEVHLIPSTEIKE